MTSVRVPHSARRLIVACIACVACIWMTAVGLTATHPRAQAPAPIENPVPRTDDSIDAGRTIYTERCADCHGDTGAGDGPVADLVRGEPSDLTDEIWDLGAADGDLFRVIRDGTRTGMRGFERTLSATEMWHVVNYVRTLAATP